MYDAVADPYCYPGTAVLKNFLKNEFEKIVAAKGKLAIGTGFWVYKAQK